VKNEEEMLEIQTKRTGQTNGQGYRSNQPRQSTNQNRYSGKPRSDKPVSHGNDQCNNGFQNWASWPSQQMVPCFQMVQPTQHSQVPPTNATNNLLDQWSTKPSNSTLSQMFKDNPLNSRG
jgi:hypothetical protein